MAERPDIVILQILQVDSLTVRQGYLRLKTIRSYYTPFNSIVLASDVGQRHGGCTTLLGTVVAPVCSTRLECSRYTVGHLFPVRPTFLPSVNFM